LRCRCHSAQPGPVIPGRDGYRSAQAAPAFRLAWFRVIMFELKQWACHPWLRNSPRTRKPQPWRPPAHNLLHTPIPITHLLVVYPRPMISQNQAVAGSRRRHENCPMGVVIELVRVMTTARRGRPGGYWRVTEVPTRSPREASTPRPRARKTAQMGPGWSPAVGG
jgi:hypothetical protein